jgi:hypothetical protein
VQAIQAKAAEASTELPPGLLSALPGGADAAIDYLRAVDIRDKLAETAERGMFGGLSGQAGTWDKIVKAYEKGCGWPCGGAAARAAALLRPCSLPAASPASSSPSRRLTRLHLHRRLAVVFLGEAAQAMVQNTDYEIPYLRKQLAKHNQQVLDADRKQAE